MEQISLDNKVILVTGAAGFIGANLVKRLMRDLTGATIVGIDNMNDYYDPSLKSSRLKELDTMGTDPGTMGTDPDAAISDGTAGSVPSVRPVEHLIYASSSSVYGGNKKVPFSTDDRVDNPVSLYAATKKSNELMAHCYSKLYDIPTTGLRFFTVYGPAGRPDMAYFGFTNKLLKGETIQIYNYGNCKRDFTYVDDIVEGIVRVMQGAPERKQGEDGLPIPPYAIYNIGGGQPENLLDFVTILQEELVRAGVLLERDFAFTPKIPLREGLRHFAEWYKSYYMK